MNNTQTVFAKSDPKYWSNHKLDYSFHAKQRVQERGIPKLEKLPESIKIAHVDYNPANGTVDAIMCKVSEQNMDFFLVVNCEGRVITTFLPNKAEYNKWMQGARRRTNKIRTGIR